MDNWDLDGHETGKVMNFINDYDGDVTYGKEVVGYNVSFTYSNGTTKHVKTSGSKLQAFYVNPNTKVKYKPIYRNYADVTVGDKTKRFYNSKKSFTNFKMDRVKFLKKMGIPYLDVKYKETWSWVGTHAYNAMICTGYAVALDTSFPGSSLPVAYAKNFIIDAGGTSDFKTQGTYKYERILVNFNGKANKYKNKSLGWMTCWDYATTIEYAPNAKNPNISTEKNDPYSYQD